MLWLPLILILPYFLLLLRIYRGILKTKPFQSSVNPVTFVSVVVACHNEQENLPLLFSDIENQDYPPDLFEIIIVDDNSDDNTFEIASQFKRTCRIIPLNNSGKGKKQAIRTGINAASGELIITTDADCRMEKNWIRTIAAFYEKNQPDLIICPVQIESRNGFFGRFQELEFLSLQGITAGSALIGEATMCNGANLSFPKETYLRHSENMHDEIPSGDDIFLLQSLKKERHSKILWLESAEAIVTTAPSPGASSFMKQRNRWISKSRAYSDKFTIALGIVTFVTIITQVSLLAAGLFFPKILLVFLTAFIIKSIPDFLILLNTSRRYGRTRLMWWFIPSQIVYPFYVLGVVCYSLISTTRISK
jgi:poly-beta-1,6-N-acetyl-D-glucosamine synthase